MYKEADLKEPEWINYFVQNTEFKDSKEEFDLSLRSFLINKINDAYYKFYKSIKKCDVPNQPFVHRLNFSLENSLIPFMNTNNNAEVIFTTTLIDELKRNKVNGISSLKEVSTIIEAFEYRQKKMGNRNVKTSCGSKNQLLEFFEFNEG